MLSILTILSIASAQTESEIATELWHRYKLYPYYTNMVQVQSNLIQQLYIDNEMLDTAYKTTLLVMSNYERAENLGTEVMRKEKLKAGAKGAGITAGLFLLIKILIFVF